MVTPTRYVLLDANVVAGYYDHTTLKHQVAVARIRSLIHSVRTGGRADIKLLISNICIAEVFNVFSKRSIDVWQGGAGLDQQGNLMYMRVFDGFTSDIHNGRLIEQIELNRYHILARHFVAPVDHHLPLPQQGNANRYINELGGTDQLVAGMAIWLSRLLGLDRFCLVTCDYRLAKVLKRERQTTAEEAIKWGLKEIEDRIGLPWSADLYPRTMDFERDDESLLESFFGEWPLPVGQVRANRAQVSRENRQVLVRLYQEMGLGRDNLPYSQHMVRLRSNFRAATGIELPEAELWRLLLASLKKGLPRDEPPVA